MIDESMDTEQMKKDPEPWEFRSKPAWQRLIIMLGGVTVNFILAFLIYIGMTWYYGDKYIANDSLKDGVWVVSQELKDAGMQSGDKIIAVDGEKLDRFNEAQIKLLTAKNITIERNGVNQDITLPIDFVNSVINNKGEKIVMPRMPFIVGGVDENSPNVNVLKQGDFITSIDTVAIRYFDEVEKYGKLYAGKKVAAKIKRDGVEEQVTIELNKDGKLGVYQAGIKPEDAEKLGLYKLNTDHYSFLESVPLGIQKGKDQLSGYFKQLKMIANPETGAYKGVGGFKAIFDIFPQTWSWEMFWGITALLSIMLGVMNLLPIPALDGGHVMFLLFEMITGKKPSDKFMEYAQVIGFVLLIALLLFANGNDIYKAIFAK